MREHCTRSEADVRALLRRWLRDSDLTQSEVARRMNRPPSYVTDLLNGRLRLRWEHVTDVLAALEASEWAFLCELYAPRAGLQESVSAVPGYRRDQVEALVEAKLEQLLETRWRRRAEPERGGGR